MDKVSAVRSSVSDAVARRGAVVVFVVLTLMLIVLVVAYIVWRMRRENTRSVEIVKAPRRLNGRKGLLLAARKMPAMSIGQAYSFSMWLYLTDLPATNLHKLLLARTGDNSGHASALAPGALLKSANPVVFLDKSSNKLHVCVRTTRKRATDASTLDHLLAGSDSPANWSHLHATVDYVPMQRWVNVAFSVRDNLLTVFLDGSVYTVESLFDMPAADASGLRPMFAGSFGDVVVGNANSQLSGDANGFVANVRFFNYGLSISNSQRVYQQGPTSAITGLRALPGANLAADYGLRSPIYRVDDEDDGDGSGSGGGSDK